MQHFREQSPLLYALVAAALASVCFQLFPSWESSMGLVDSGTLRQSASAAFVVAAMYLFSGEYLIDTLLDTAAAGQCAAMQDEQATHRTFSVVRIAAAVLAAAAVIGIAKVYVQGSTITPPRTAILVFIAMLLATAVFEEVLFRGLFFEAFAKTLHDRASAKALLWAALASSVLFGLLHVSSDLGSLFRATAYIQAVVKVAEGTLFGLAMCAVYVKTKSVWTAVALHAAFDLVSEVPIYLATGVRTSTYITGSPADIAVLAAGTAVLAVAAAWAWGYLKATP